MPIIASKNGRRVKTQTEEDAEKALEKKRNHALTLMRQNLQKVNAKKSQSSKEGIFYLSKEDKKRWWDFIQNNYPQNHALAEKYYASEDDPALSRLGIDKKDYTVNEVFEIYGLPRIYTDENHEIKVIQ